MSGTVMVFLSSSLLVCCFTASTTSCVVTLPKISILTHSLLHHELADGLERGGDGLGAGGLGVLGGNLGGGVGGDGGEHVTGRLLREAEGLEVVAEVAHGDGHDVAGGPEVGLVLDENDGGLLGNLLVGLHVEAGGTAHAGRGDSLGGADALRDEERGNEGSVSSIDGGKKRSKTLKP